MASGCQIVRKFLPTAKEPTLVSLGRGRPAIHEFWFSLVSTQPLTATYYPFTQHYILVHHFHGTKKGRHVYWKCPYCPEDKSSCPSIAIVCFLPPAWPEKASRAEPLPSTGLYSPPHLYITMAAAVVWLSPVIGHLAIDIEWVILCTVYCTVQCAMHCNVYCTVVKCSCSVQRHNTSYSGIRWTDLFTRLK